MAVLKETKKEETQKREEKAEMENKTMTAEEYMNERVECFLHKPDGVKDSSRTVTVNGKNFQIQYNKRVMVPRYVAEVVNSAEKADRKATEMIEGAQAII